MLATLLVPVAAPAQESAPQQWRSALEYVHDEIPPPGAVRDDQRVGPVLRVRL